MSAPTGSGFHDRTLAGLAVMEAWLERDTEKLRAVVETADEGELIGGLVNVCRYLLHALETAAGVPDALALRAIREGSVKALSELPDAPAETNPAEPDSSTT